MSVMVAPKLFPMQQFVQRNSVWLIFFRNIIGAAGDDDNSRMILLVCLS